MGVPMTKSLETDFEHIFHFPSSRLTAVNSSTTVDCTYNEESRAISGIKWPHEIITFTFLPPIKSGLEHPNHFFETVMIQRQKLLKEMRSRTVSSDASGTSFLAPLTLDSIKKINSGANFPGNGIFSSIKVGRSEKTRSATSAPAATDGCVDDYTNNSSLLKELATENAALQLKLEAVAHERNRYRDQVLASIKEASRKSVVCEISCQTDPPEVVPESVDKKIVDKLKEKIDVLQNRFKEIVMSNDLLELKIATAAAQEKEATRSWEAQIKHSQSLLEEQREQSTNDLVQQRNELLVAFGSQTKEIYGVCEEQKKESLKNLFDELAESVRLREEDRIFHESKVRVLEDELEKVRSQVRAQPDPAKCNKQKNINKAKSLFIALKSEHVADKRFNADLIKKFDDYLRVCKEELAIEINKKFDADAAQYALNLKFKDCEAKNLFGRMKILDGLLCAAVECKMKIANQAKGLSARATSGLVDVVDKHTEMVLSMQEVAHLQDLSRVASLRETALERDRALNDLQYTRDVINVVSYSLKKAEQSLLEDHPDLHSQLVSGRVKRLKVLQEAMAVKKRETDLRASELDPESNSINMDALKDKAKEKVAVVTTEFGAIIDAMRAHIHLAETDITAIQK